MSRIRSTEDRVIDILAIIIVAIAAICCLYPVVYCASMSFSDDDAILKSSVRLLPKGFNLESYQKVLADPTFLISFKNAVIQTILATLSSLFYNLAFGYVLMRHGFFHNALTKFMLVPMMFGGGLIPSFLLIKSLGLYNTIWSLIIPAASFWNAILARTFFQSTIPQDVIESAVIDGANEFQIFLKIVLPLSTTIIAILALYAAVGRWNDYFGPLIYLRDETLQPLQLYLKDILSTSATQKNMSSMLETDNYVKNFVNAERIKYVLIIVSCLPIMVVYPFIQKYFVKGVMLGSVKG